MRVLLGVVFCLLFLAQTGIAGDEGGADAFLKGKLEEVVDVLQERDVEVQKKNEEIEALRRRYMLEEGVDSPKVRALSRILDKTS